jgi:hypothetical protein
MANHDNDGFLTWLIAHVFTAGVLSLTMDFARAFFLGIIGAFGGLFAKWFYYKFLKEKK